MATLDFYASTVTTLTSGGAGPADWAASSGTRASCLRLDDGTNIIQAVRSHASDSTTYYFLCSDWRCVDDDVPIAEKIPEGSILTASTRYAMTFKRTGGNAGTRFDDNAIRMLIGAETYAGVTQAHSGMTPTTSYAEYSVPVSVDSGDVTLARLRDATMTVQGIGAIRTNGASLEVDQFVIRVTYAGPADACSPESAKAMTFNGGVSSTGGLALVSPSGDVTPRYTDDAKTVVGLGTHGTLGPGDIRVYPYACGLGRNGEKLAVIFESPSSKCVIIQDGTRVFERALSAAGGAGGGKPTTISDLLRDQTGEVTDLMFNPKTAVIHDGLIVVACECYTYDGSGAHDSDTNWSAAPDRIGLAWTYDNGATWDTAYQEQITGTTGIVNTLLQVWAMTGHTLNLGASADRDELWIAVNIYALPKTISIPSSVYVAKFGWDGADWATDGVLLLPGSTLVRNETHYHSACVYRYGDGLAVDYSRGDSLGNHAILRMSRGDTNYLEDTQAIAGSSGFYEAATDGTTSGWDDDAPRTVHGGLLSEFTTSLARSCPQPLGLLRDGVGVVCSCDETWVAFLRYAYATPASPDACEFERMECGADGFANIRTVGGTTNGVGRLALAPRRADCWSEYPAMVAMVTPGDKFVASNATRQAAAARIMYRPPNTDAWCVVDAPTFSGGADATVSFPVGVWPDGMLLLPNTGAGTTIRTLTPGSTLVARPLTVSPGGTSYMRTTSFGTADVQANNTFTVDYDWTLAGAPDPPVASPIVNRCARITLANTGGTGAGRLNYGGSTDIGDPTGLHIQVVFWIYPIGQKSVGWRFDLHHPGNPSAKTDYSNYLAIAPRQWTRVSVEVDPGVLPTAWRFGMLIDNQYNASPVSLGDNDALIYVESLSQTSTGLFSTKELVGTGTGSGGYTATPDDDFEVTGLSCAQDYWTVGMILRRPEHGADSSAALFTGDEPLATLWQTDSLAVEVWAALDDRKLTITYPDGTTVADVAAPEHMRGDPVFVWIVRDYTDLTVYFSVGGMQIYTAALSASVSDSADFNPTKIKLGQNADGSVVGAVDVFAVFSRDCYAATAAQVAEHMADLAMAYSTGGGFRVDRGSGRASRPLGGVR